MSDTFLYHGEELHYFDHLYNLTMLNERRVEMAIVDRWLHRSARSSLGLEVGNVTGHYWPQEHDVFDLYEPREWYQEQNVRAVDILDCHPEHPWRQYPWVLSISTIEHTDDPLKALDVLCTLVAPGGQLFVTFPTGVSDELNFVARSGVPFERSCTFTRVAGGSDWAQDPIPVISPYGPWANSVFIGEWSRPT